MKIAVVTDSNSGITQAQGKELGITVLPMPFMIDGNEFFEDMIERGIFLKYEPEVKKETDNIEEVNIEDLLFEGQGGQMMFF